MIAPSSSLTLDLTLPTAPSKQSIVLNSSKKLKDRFNSEMIINDSNMKATESSAALFKDIPQSEKKEWDSQSPYHFIN